MHHDVGNGKLVHTWSIESIENEARQHDGQQSVASCAQYSIPQLLRSVPDHRILLGPQRYSLQQSNELALLMG